MSSIVLLCMFLTDQGMTLAKTDGWGVHCGGFSERGCCWPMLKLKGILAHPICQLSITKYTLDVYKYPYPFLWLDESELEWVRSKSCNYIIHFIAKSHYKWTIILILKIWMELTVYLEKATIVYSQGCVCQCVWFVCVCVCVCVCVSLYINSKWFNGVMWNLSMLFHMMKARTSSILGTGRSRSRSYRHLKIVLNLLQYKLSGPST